MLRNDPYACPATALRRQIGHSMPASSGKMKRLFQPLAATGVPLGGIGTGGITRSSDGRFSRWTIKGGGVAKFDMPANGFLLRVHRDSEDPIAVALQPKPETDELSAFEFEQQSPEWGGLFPFAWHRHKAVSGVEAECLSFSPFIPQDLSCSTLPVGVFKFRVTNNGATNAEVSIALTFANMNGWFGEFHEGRPARVAAGCLNRPANIDEGSGVILARRRTSEEPVEGTGEWAIAMTSQSGAEFSRTVCFNGIGTGEDFWNGFLETGHAPDNGEGWVTESGFRETPPDHPTAAVAAKLTLGPGESGEVTAALVWDLPTITFGQGRSWYRAYTDDWDRRGRNSQRIAEWALQSSTDWERRISTWHEIAKEVMGDLPHQAGVPINECYFLVDGLSVATSAHGSPDGRRHFGLIECHDYALYNTLDLWIYAAEAVAQFFPELAAGVACDYAGFLIPGDRGERRHRWDGTPFPINRANSCPHDLGGPGEDPFVTPNSYTYRDGTLWKDLNCDLVICVLREGRWMDAEWRRRQFPAVRASIDHLQQFDRDGDGLIENEGIPDQTFDNIPMTGPSSYCGGLWIATLLAAAALAEEVGEFDLAEAWRRQADRASTVYNDRLFNGRWFRVDSDGPFSEACFIEQLFGPFLARRLGLGDIVPPDRARSALRSVFELNFLEAGGGEGAVSLSGIPKSAMSLLPHQEDTSFQTAEIQPGFNFSFAAQLEAWGLVEEADELRRALHRELYEKRNLVFQTPAAFDRGSMTCRAVLNMRPLASWWLAPGNHQLFQSNTSKIEAIGL